MSTIYVLEPPTKGKVIVNTTYGPLDIELWPKEAPKAVRNFVQLCLEGYYDNTIFHRIIKGFLVQCGDPTGTGSGGESIYGSIFADEFHSRLRFNHRGIVACANAGSPNSNGSQFFISLDKCDWLDKKSTIFGKVTGDSIYNLLSLGEVETDKDDRPLDPAPKIKSIEVLWNPFEDIVPRGPSKPLDQSAAETENKDSKKKAVKKLNLLSFGDEAEEEEKELAVVKQKIKSSHDVLDDPRLLKEERAKEELNDAEAKARRDRQLSVREALSSKKDTLKKDSDDELHNGDDDDDDNEDVNFDARMRQQILKRRMDMGDIPSKQKHNGRSSPKSSKASTSRPISENNDDDRPKVEKLSMKKKGIGSEARAERLVKSDVDLQLFSESERGRLLNKQKKRRLQGREEEVLAKLENFKKTTLAKPVSSNTESGGAYKEDLSDWSTVRLKFAPEPGKVISTGQTIKERLSYRTGPQKDRMSRRDDPNDYVVHDPLLEKGKEKFNKMQAKQKRLEREWAGKSLT